MTLIGKNTNKKTPKFEKSEEKTMNRIFLKLTVGTMLTLLMLAGGMQISVSGQSTEGHETSEKEASK
jgi:hypothetical protein